MPIKVEDSQGYMTSTYIIDGILYAIKNGASIINLSVAMEAPLNSEISEEIQKQIIQNELGITFSFGLARTKVLAKIGSKANKPDGFSLIKPEMEDEYEEEDDMEEDSMSNLISMIRDLFNNKEK